jgi:hypothetical protein
MRFRLTEITPRRVYDAVYRRVQDVPDAFAWKQSSQSRANRERLYRYHDIHRGERCVVIANGPSLGQMDLSCLRDARTISMNRAYLLYREWGFCPSYYACINELVLEQFADDIERLSMPRFINFNRRQLFSNMRDDDQLMYLRLGLNFQDRFTGDISQPMSSGGTVTFACLQLAYFMGFEEVVLIGLDHNFVEKGVPNTTEIRQSDRDESHCHPDYFPKGIKWQLPDLYRSELAYAMARQAFERDSRRVLDATIGGKCNVFPKVDFSSLF